MQRPWGTQVQGKLFGEAELWNGWGLEGVRDFCKYGHNSQVKGLEIWKWEVLAVGNWSWYLSKDR